MGGVLAIAFLICIFGGGKQISKVTGDACSVMEFYIAVSLFIVITHINLVPSMIADIVRAHLTLRQFLEALQVPPLCRGIKRDVSNRGRCRFHSERGGINQRIHPKQGLVQMLSVYIDTIVICTATAFMLLYSGVEPSKEIAGMSYVQAAGKFPGRLRHRYHYGGPLSLCIYYAIGNFYYAEMGLGFAATSAIRRQAAH